MTTTVIEMPTVTTTTVIIRREERQRENAYHEAGHAVAYFVVFGEYDLLEVTIDRKLTGRASGGYARRRPCQPMPTFYLPNPDGFLSLDRSRAFGLALACYAGGAAVQHYGRLEKIDEQTWDPIRHHPAYLRMTMKSDLRALEHMAAFYGHHFPSDTLDEKLWEGTEALCADLWPAVEAVACALLERKTLPGDEVAAIIRATCPEAETWSSRLEGLAS